MTTDNTDEATGIAAIIYLQAAAGILETEDQAREGWRAMSAHDRKWTMLVYEAMKLADARETVQ